MKAESKLERWIPEESFEVGDPVVDDFHPIFDKEVPAKFRMAARNVSCAVDYPLGGDVLFYIFSGVHRPTHHAWIGNTQAFGDGPIAGHSTFWNLPDQFVDEVCEVVVFFIGGLCGRQPLLFGNLSLAAVFFALSGIVVRNYDKNGIQISVEVLL